MNSHHSLDRHTHTFSALSLKFLWIATIRSMILHKTRWFFLLKLRWTYQSTGIIRASRAAYMHRLRNLTKICTYARLNRDGVCVLVLEAAGSGRPCQEENRPFSGQQHQAQFSLNPALDFTALNCYPLIRKLYIELNIGIASKYSSWETVFAGGEFSLLCDLSLAVNTEMMLFMLSVKLWIAAAETLVSLGRRVISPLWFRLNTEGFIDFFCCNKKYTGDTYVYVCVIKKYCSESIGIGIGNTFKKYC